MACAKDCLVSCVKVFLIALNVIFLTIGGGLIAVGVWMKVDMNAVTYMRLLSTDAKGPALDIIAWVCIGVGAFLFLISFLGCCGTCCESHMMLYFYVVLLVLVMAAEITAAVLAYIYRSQVDNYLGETMMEQIRLHYNGSAPQRQNQTDALTAAWDSMQWRLKCCGAMGPLDYKYSMWYNTTGEKNMEYVPQSCCSSQDNDKAEFHICRVQALDHFNTHYGKQKVTEKDKEVPIDNFLQTQGCKAALLEWMKKHMAYVIGIAAGILGLQIIVFVLSCCLLQHVRRKLEDYDF